MGHYLLEIEDGGGDFLIQGVSSQVGEQDGRVKEGGEGI